MDIQEGTICALQLLGDFFGSEDAQSLADRLIGCRNCGEDARCALEDLDLFRFVRGLPRICRFKY